MARDSTASRAELFSVGWIGGDPNTFRTGCQTGHDTDRARREPETAMATEATNIRTGKTESTPFFNERKRF